ncbi:hypothetical protein N9H24_02775, partial [Planktomarina temperata]|nr:hypothetical protein [Planktomarina temperata]
MPKDLNASVTDGLVAVDGIVSSTHPKAYVALVSSREDLPLVLHRATLAGESLLTVFVADSDDDLDAFASSGRVEIEEIELPDEPAARTKLLADWVAKASRKNKKSLVPLLLLPLAACMGGGADAPAPTFVVTESDEGDLSFSGTATGDVSVEVASNGDMTFSRGDVTATQEAINVETVDTAPEAVLLSNNITGMALADAAKLVDITNFSANGKTIALSDLGVVSASDLVNVFGEFASVDASTFTGLTGSAVDLSDTYASTNVTGLGNESVTITGADPSVVQLNAIALATSGIVTASISGTAAALNSGLGNLAGTDAIIITLDAGVAEATDLTGLDSKTSVAVGATAVTGLTGSAEEIAAVIAAHNADPSTITLDDDYTVEITGDVAATVDELVAINNDTDGAITLNAATNSANWSDTAANLVDAFDGITSLIGNLVVVGTASKEQIEILVTMASGSLTATLEDNTGGLITLDLSAGGAATSTINNITLGDGLVNVSGGTASDNITLGDGLNTLNLGGGADTVVGTDVTADGDTINTGDGSDTVTVNKDNGIAYSVSINTGAGDDSININNGAVDSGDAVTLVGGDDNDTLTITGTNNFSGSADFVGIETVLIRSDVTFTLDQIAAVGGNIAVHPDQFTEGVVTGSHAITIAKTADDTATDIQLTNLKGVTAVEVGAGVSVEISDAAASELATSAATDGISFEDATASVVVSQAAKTTLEAAVTVKVAGAETALPYVIKDTAANIKASLDTTPTYVSGSSGNITVTNDTSASSAANLKAVLDKVAAASKAADATAITSLSGTYADVAAVVDHEAGSVATLADDFSVSLTAGAVANAGELALVNKALGATTGAVTGTISGAAATLASLSTTATNGLTISVTDATAAPVNASDLKAIGIATSGTATVANKVAISGNIADVTAALVTPASKVVLGTADTPVTVADAVTAAEGAAIATVTNAAASFTTGVVDALGNLSSGGTINSNLNALAGDDTDVAIAISDADNFAAEAADLKVVGGATTGTVTVTNQAAISGNIADVTAALITDASKVVLSKASTATVADAVTAKQGGDIAGLANVTATFTTGVNDSLTNLLASAEADIDKVVADHASVAIAINDTAGHTPTAANLSTIGGKTSGTVTVDNAAAISGSVADVTAALVTDLTKVVLGADSTVTVSGAVTAKEGADIAGVAKATTTFSNGVADALDKLAASGAITTDLTGLLADDATVTITINDAGTLTAAAADLKAVGGATSGAVNVANAAAISGTAADVTAALVDAETKVALDTASTVSVSDAVSASAGAAIAGVANATATYAGGVADAMANLYDTGAPGVTSDLNDILLADNDAAIAVTDTSGSIKAADLSALQAANAAGGVTLSGAATPSATVTVTGNFAEVTQAVVTDGVVALGADVSMSGDAGTDVAANGLSAIMAKVGSVTVTDAINVTGNDAQVKSALVDDQVSASLATVEISGPATVATVKALYGVATGTITADLTATDTLADLADLVAAGKSNALSLRVADEVISNAADLVALEAITTVTIVAPNVMTVTGVPADLDALRAKIDAGDINASIFYDVVIADDDDTAGATLELAATDLSDTAEASLLAVDAFDVSKLNGSAAEVLDAYDDGVIGLGDEVIVLTEASNTIDAATLMSVVELVKTLGGVDASSVTEITGSLSKLLDVQVASADDLQTASTYDAIVTDVTPTADAADLKKIIVDANGGSVDFKKIAEITGKIADITYVFGDANTDLAADVAVDVDAPGATASEVASIAGATSGVVTATVVVGSDTASDLVVALDPVGGGAAPTDKLTIQLGDATASAADLSKLATLSANVINADSVGTISGTAAELKSLLDTHQAGGDISLGAATVDLSVTSDAANTSPSLSDINTLATELRTGSSLAGKITATVHGTVSAADAKDLTTPGTDAITLQLSAEVIADASNLATIASKTSEKIDATLATGVKGTGSSVATALESTDVT